MTETALTNAAETLEDAIRSSFVSENVVDSNLEPANVVDVLNYIAKGVNRLSHSILPDAAPGHDETGGTVASLTEAVMGMTAGLCRIADSISELAEAVKDHKEPI